MCVCGGYCSGRLLNLPRSLVTAKCRVWVTLILGLGGLVTYCLLLDFIPSCLKCYSLRRVFLGLSSRPPSPAGQGWVSHPLSESLVQFVLLILFLKWSFTLQLQIVHQSAALQAFLVPLISVKPRSPSLHSAVQSQTL